ncbi:MAG: basic amino acid/polyamine antiporter [Elusimicrobium sp.]|jgi:arginine:ornithine antiporter/lysine permease|nr:basic amino acid/polyamine antiporter [Elusimicrobium sp.]
MKNSLKLGFLGLTGLVISATVGSGVFALPQNMADGAGAAAVLAAWIITGVGMYFLTDAFRVLATVRPDLTSGLYAYAKEGFGETAGFFTAWGYWFSNACAVSAFLVVLMESLNYFFPGAFTGGNNLNSIILSSVVIWCFYALISKGIKETAFINLLGTIFKLFPVFLFILILFLTVKLPVLKTALTQNAATDLGVSFSGQIKNAMIVTLWAFIGIETTVVLAGRAKSGKTVSAALMTAFLLCITIYVCVSVLPFGVLGRAQIAAMENPSTAGILEYIIGRAGGIIMNAGMIVSVFFAILSLTTITAEVPFSAAKDNSFPRQFTKENKNLVPVFSLFITTLTVQALLFVGFVSANAFQTLLTITAVMIMPVYLITPLYLLKISGKKFPQGFNVGVNRARLSAAAGALYAVWLIYAANIKYLLIALAIFLAGIPVYLLAKKQK